MTARADLYFISVAAQLLGMHPQTLRKYERLGLIRPQRTGGSVRVYTHEEIERLRLIKTLVDDAGINLAGVSRLLSIAEIAGRLRPLAEARGAPRAEVDKQLAHEVDEIFRILGIPG